MTVRDTYQASVKTASVAKVASNAVNSNTHQESISAVGVNIGANPQLGVTAAHQATIATANETYNANKQNAEMVKQVAIQAAKDILRQTDTAPA